MNDDPLIGRQLSNFIIERVLGRGGMAQVYYGHDVKLQRPVAIKVIDARYRGQPIYAQRFIKEARAVARWRHENIIHIYYADDQDGLYYYVMEYIAGQDLANLLSDYVTRGDLLPPGEVLRIGGAIARALDYAHSQGIIHRDVKPSNVLIASDGRVVLSDFGLALDLQEGSLGEALGTPHYISPEQAWRSTEAVPQSDLYSLGVILYEMLTGIVPFDDPSPTSVALQHITQDPPAPRSVNPQLSVGTESVLLRALSKKPKDRYQTGAELMQALEKALADTQTTHERILPLPPMPAAIVAGKTRAVTQRPPEPITVKARSRKRWPLIAWFAIALLVTLLIGYVALSSRGAASAILPTSTATTTSTATVPPATRTPTNTRIPTDTAAPTRTETRTPAPSTTLTLTVVASPSATSTAPASATPVPSATETSTISPAGPTATTTPPFVNGKRMWLYYDAYGFYIYNAANASRSISVIAFERIDENGSALNRFDGSLWTQYANILFPRNCMRIEIQNNPGNYLNPGNCNNSYLSTRSIAQDSELIFWTQASNSTQFRVLWKGAEVGTCDIVAGFCEVFVP